MGGIGVGIAKAVGNTMGSIGQMVLGARQKKWAKNLKKNDFVASEFTKNQELAEQGAYSARSQNQGADEAALRKQAAGGRYSASQMAGSAAKRLAGMAGQENTYLNQLSRLRQQGRRERVGRVNRSMMANEKVGTLRQENERRFQDQKEALRGASIQNIYGGIDNFGKGVANSLSLFGGKKGGGTQIGSGYGGPTVGADVEGTGMTDYASSVKLGSTSIPGY